MNLYQWRSHVLIFLLVLLKMFILYYFLIRFNNMSLSYYDLEIIQISEINKYTLFQL